VRALDELPVAAIGAPARTPRPGGSSLEQRRLISRMAMRRSRASRRRATRA
jgi:hypothetical protein